MVLLMIESFIRTFIMVIITDMASASQFAVSACAIHSKYFWAVVAGGMCAYAITTFLGAEFGKVMTKLPISPNLVSGIIMVCMGFVFIWRN